MSRTSRRRSSKRSTATTRSSPAWPATPTTSARRSTPGTGPRGVTGCPTRPDLCPGGTHGRIKKTPSEYLKQIYFDTMVFRPEGVRHLAAEVGPSQLIVGTDIGAFTRDYLERAV